MNMTEAVILFESAQKLLDAQSAVLDEYVQEQMDDMVDNIGKLQFLASMLPKTYKGTRRVYQRILELDDILNKDVDTPS